MSAEAKEAAASASASDEEAGTPAAPAPAVSGRDKILQAARSLERRRAATVAPRSEPPAVAQHPKSKPQSYIDDKQFLATIPAKERPTLPYDVKSKVPRINRQLATDRLIVQHLRLMTQTSSDKLAAAGNPAVWKLAIANAKAQELALYKRATSKQLYQNLLVRIKASDLAAPAAATAHNSPVTAAASSATAPAESSGPFAPPAGDNVGSPPAAPESEAESGAEPETHADADSSQQQQLQPPDSLKRKRPERDSLPGAAPASPS